MSVQIWAHRGNSCQYPENTMEAFASALSVGADGLELDVHLTSDGQIVVTHDESVERVSNGTGRVVDQTLSQLRAYSFDKTHPGAAPGAKIPLLSEVLELVQPTSASINIEIKSGVVLYEGIEKAVLSLVRSFHMQERIFYSSFNHFSLMTVKQLEPSARIGLLYSAAMVDPAHYAAHIGAQAIHPFYPSCFAPGVMEGCIQRGIAVHPWTVDDPTTMKKLAAVGVQALITNDPARALSTVGQSL